MTHVQNNKEVFQYPIGATACEGARPPLLLAFTQAGSRCCGELSLANVVTDKHRTKL